jgi:hypothetical protein
MFRSLAIVHRPSHGLDYVPHMVFFDFAYYWSKLMTVFSHSSQPGKSSCFSVGYVRILVLSSQHPQPQAWS